MLYFKQLVVQHITWGTGAKGFVEIFGVDVPEDTVDFITDCTGLWIFVSRSTFAVLVFAPGSTPVPAEP